MFLVRPYRGRVLGAYFRVMCPSIVICAVVNHVSFARMTKVQEKNWVAVIHYMGTIKKSGSVIFLW